MILNDTAFNRATLDHTTLNRATLDHTAINHVTLGHLKHALALTVILVLSSYFDPAPDPTSNPKPYSK